MRITKSAGLVLGLVLAITCAYPALAEKPLPYKHQATKNLVALVNDAARLIASKGQAAFGELRAKDSRWFKGDLYVFITTPQGIEVVNPAFPHLEGKSIKDLRDAGGKPMVRYMIEDLYGPAGRTSSWVHYLWPRPGTLDPAWKSTYVVRAKAPDGKEYIVGAGLYDMKMERRFIVDKVELACRLIAAKGPAAFDELRKRDGRFIFANTYVFVDDTKGVELVNPAFPGLQGRNLMRFTDVEGLPIVRIYIDKVKKSGQGWVGYYLPRPGSKKPAIKHTFVKGVKYGGKLYIVGSGYYLN